MTWVTSFSWERDSETLTFMVSHAFLYPNAIREENIVHTWFTIIDLLQEKISTTVTWMITDPSSGDPVEEFFTSYQGSFTFLDEIQIEETKNGNLKVLECFVLWYASRKKIVSRLRDCFLTDVSVLTKHLIPKCNPRDFMAC